MSDRGSRPSTPFTFKRFAWLLVACGLAAWLAPAGAQPAESNPPNASDAARSVTVEAQRVTPTDSRQTHIFHGVVQARQRAMLGFETAGRLRSRSARVGDRVRRGQRLARVDGRGYRNEVRAARANAEEVALRSEQLARDQARAQELRAAGVTTSSRLEQVTNGAGRAEVMRTAAGARLAEARRRADETTLRAPFDGVVTDVFVEPGEVVSAGQPILRVVGLEGHEVVLQVDAELAGHVRPGAELSLSVSGLAPDDPLARRELVGRVRSAVADATGLDGLFPVAVDLADAPSLRGGLGVEATIVGPPRTAVRVPLGAVLDPSGRRPFVWTLIDGRAERAWVRIGRLSGDLVELTEGVEPGALIAVRGHTRLLPGDRVEVSP